MKHLLLILLFPALLSGCIDGSRGDGIDSLENYSPPNIWFGVVEVDGYADRPDLEPHFRTYGAHYPPSFSWDEKSKTVTFTDPSNLWLLKDGYTVLLVIDHRESPLIQSTISRHGADVPGYYVRVEHNNMEFHMLPMGDSLASFFFGPFDAGNPFDVYTRDAAEAIARENGEDLRNFLEDRSITYHRLVRETGMNITANAIQDVDIEYDTTITFTYYGIMKFIPDDPIREYYLNDSSNLNQEREIERIRRELRS